MATESLPLDKKSAKRLKAVLARTQHTINECECAIEELQEVASELWDASVDLDGCRHPAAINTIDAGIRYFHVDNGDGWVILDMWGMAPRLIGDTSWHAKR